jgi:uridine kinase
MVDNKAKNTKKPTLVIICGGSGSGKTTVAEKITSALDKGITYSIISLDNYYLPSYLIKTTNYDEPNALD